MDHRKLLGPVQKKQKQRKINYENTFSEWRSDSWLENKTESREEKGVVKIFELDSDNSGVERDSSNEPDIDELSDSLRPIGILSMHSCSAEHSCQSDFCTILFQKCSICTFLL